MSLTRMMKKKKKEKERKVSTQVRKRTMIPRTGGNRQGNSHDPYAVHRYKIDCRYYIYGAYTT